MYIDPPNCCHISPLSCINPFSFFFLFAPLDEFLCHVFEFTDHSFTCSSVLLNPCIEFFSSVIVFFSSLLSAWYFLIFSLCCNSHFVHALLAWLQWSSLLLLFWALSGKLLIFVSLRSVSGDYLVLFRIFSSPSSFSLTLCVGLCVLHKIAISSRWILSVSPPELLVACQTFLCLFKLLSLFLVALSNWGYVKTSSVPKRRIAVNT